MARTPLIRGALAVFVLSLVVAAPASARMDTVSKAQTGARLQFSWPAVGTVTSRFGEWRGGRRHEGVDIGMLRRLGVRSALPGRVRVAGYAPGYAGYGKTVVVSYGKHHKLLYAHLSKVYVKRGQLVRRGQPLGLAGCTGSCYGTHLHFEVLRRGVPINPARFVG